MAEPNFSAQLGLILMPSGTFATTWGDNSNINYQILEQGVCGYAAISLPSSGQYVLTSTKGLEAESSNESRQRMLELTGSLTAPVTVIVPPIDKFYYVIDNTTGGQTVSFSTLGGVPVEVPPGFDAIMGCDSIDCFRVQQEVEKDVIENTASVSIQQQQIQDLQDFLDEAGSSPQAYPIGAYFFCDNNANPNALLGYGSWVREAKGATIFGQDNSVIEFDTPGKTGGSKTFALAKVNLPAHTHNLVIHPTGRHTHTMSYPSSFTGRTEASGGVPATSSVGSIRVTGKSGAHNHTPIVANTGGGTPFSILPQYRVTYIWRRTA